MGEKYLKIKSSGKKTSNKKSLKIKSSGIKNLGIKSLQKGFELPPAALMRASKITISSNKEAVIEGCRGILEYCSDRIKLNIGCATVLFIGNSLTIDSLNVGSIVISGKITNVEF